MEPQAPPFPVGRVEDSVLAEQRGGIRLPNGIDVNLSIDTVTAINGRIVLQTVTRITEGSPVVTAYVPVDDTHAPLAQQDKSVAEAKRDPPPRVIYDRQYGLSVTANMPVVPVRVTAGEAGDVPQESGLRAIDLTGSTTTPNGIVQARDDAGVGGVELQGTDIRILHLTHSAIGSAIANTGSGRSIDTYTTVSIDLRNAGPEVLGSAMSRVEGVALGALASRF